MHTIHLCGFWQLAEHNPFIIAFTILPSPYFIHHVQCTCTIPCTLRVAQAFLAQPPRSNVKLSLVTTPIDPRRFVSEKLEVGMKSKAIHKINIGTPTGHPREMELSWCVSARESLFVLTAYVLWSIHGCYGWLWEWTRLWWFEKLVQKGGKVRIWKLIFRSKVRIIGLSEDHLESVKVNNLFSQLKPSHAYMRITHV